MKHDLTNEQLDELISTGKPVLIDFSAAWCGPCKMLAPIFERVAEENGDRVEFVKIDIDEQMDTAASYGVQAVPTIVAIKDGEVVHNSAGLMNQPALTALVDKLAE